MSDIRVTASGIPGAAGAFVTDATAWFKGVNALPQTALGASLGLSGTKIKGYGIDRSAFGLPMSAQFVIPIRTTLASGHTLTLALEAQHSDDATDGDFVGYGDAIDNVVLTGNNDGSELVTDLRVNWDLEGTKEFVRLNLTPTLSASGTDVARVGAVAVLAGSDQLLSN